jgi:hypothetical protein
MVPENQPGFPDQKGMRRDGPNPGIFIAADPATVERQGKCHRPREARMTGDNGVFRKSEIPDRAGHWRGGMINRRGRLFIYESSRFHDRQTRREGGHLPLRDGNIVLDPRARRPAIRTG